MKIKRILFVITILAAPAIDICAQDRSGATYSATSSADSVAGQNRQTGKRYTQKQVNERMRAESHANAAIYRTKFEANLKIAADKKEEIHRRRGALADLARSQDLRAAGVLLKFMESDEKSVADNALGSLSLMAYIFSLNEDIDQLKELKRIAEPKILSIAKEEPVDMNRAASVVGILNNLGDDAEAAKLAKKLLEKGNYQVINQFYYRDQSTTPSTPRIKPAARQLFLDSISEKQPEDVRINAAAMLAKAGDIDLAFSVFTEVMLKGTAVGQRQKAMYELRTIGDKRSKEAVRKALDIPVLASSAEDALMFWPKR